MGVGTEHPAGMVMPPDRTDLTGLLYVTVLHVRCASRAPISLPRRRGR